MRQDQIYYWVLVATTLGVFSLGVWITFFSKNFLADRFMAKNNRLGKTAVVVLISMFRILGYLLVVLTIFQWTNLMRILPYAPK